MHVLGVRRVLAARLGAVLVGAALAPALVVAGPAREAAALAAPPLPVAFTGSWIGATTSTITLPETAVVGARAGAAVAAAASGTTAVGGAATVVAGAGVVGTTGVALYGLGLGLVIGDGLVQFANLGLAEQDQLTPLSSMLIDALTPSPDYVAPAGSAAGPGVQLGPAMSASVTIWAGNPAAGQNECAASGPVSATFAVYADGIGTGAAVITSTTSAGTAFASFQCGQLPDSTRGAELLVQYQCNGAHASGVNFQTWVNGTSSRSVSCADAGRAGEVITAVTTRLYNGFVSGSPRYWEASSGSAVPSGPAPQAALETRAMCSGVLAAERSVTFDRAAAEWPAPPSVTCPGAVTPSRVEVWEVIPGTATETLLSRWDAPALDPALMPRKGATLDLLRVNPEPAVSCFSSPAGCAQWFSDPAKTSNYRCTYGGVTVALSECNVYRPSFDTASRTPYADAGGNVPGPSPSAPTGDPQVAQDEADRRCYPTGWGVLNPVSWVLRPLRCAFEPREVVIVEATSQLRGALATSGPGPLVAGVSGIFASFGSWQATATDCRGPQVAWHQSSSVIGTHTWSAYPFAACEAPMTTLSGYARAFAAVALWLAALVTGAATVAKAFGLDLPFSPAGGEE